MGSGEWGIGKSVSSLFPTPHSPLPTPHSPLSTPRSLFPLKRVAQNLQALGNRDIRRFFAFHLK